MCRARAKRGRTHGGGLAREMSAAREAAKPLKERHDTIEPFILAFHQRARFEKRGPDFGRAWTWATPMIASG